MAKKTTERDINTNCKEEVVFVVEPEAQKQPLLATTRRSPARKVFIQQAITQTFQIAAHLANLLPTGTVLAFHLLSPVFTNQGQCDSVSRAMTAGLIGLCGFSCLVSSFTDSFNDDEGTVRYGMATFHGLWVIDGSRTLPHEKAQLYRIKFVDFLHAFMSLLVFTAVALFDNDVVSCFYPVPSPQKKELLTSLPVGIGVVCSMLFVVFPTTRHGIGFPVAPKL